MPKIQCFCTICGKEFYVWPFKIRQGGGKVCSMSCLFKYRKRYLHKGNFKKGQHPSKGTEFKKGNFGNLSPAWKNGRTNNGSGYIKVPTPRDHPIKSFQDKIYEHRLVMEEYLGRYLKKEEVVHHINGNRSDNRIENLELLSSQSEHMRKHTPQNIDGKRKCYKCKTIYNLDFDNFYHDRKCFKGFGYRCKKCTKIHRLRPSKNI